MKRYNLINNALGWLCFFIAAATYLLTVEPTASFWDCPEFISQGFKLEVGHPPGNPIFMLAARFCINFVGGDVTKVALAVNCMSALLSAGTILLLFWSITHLVRRLICRDDATEYSWAKMITIFGSGIVGALAYTWSDTFWFSAVEGEVYAFSSFCTALVIWLIFKWENRADSPHSDRYLILIAYVIGISIAVHLLNLLCIPAIVLVVYFKKFKSVSTKGSLIALCVSFVIVALILYGLVPGFIEVAQYFELLAVNVMHLSYNTGVLIYAILTFGIFIWTIYELYTQRHTGRIKAGVVLSVLFSGIPFIGDSLWIPVLIVIALVAYLSFTSKLPVRIINIAVMSIMVIFIGYSSYALLLIRSSANTPMNQNSPDNVFDLGSYLNREQYGERPLLYGETFTSDVLRDSQGMAIYSDGPAQYSKTVKSDPSEPDRYVVYDHKKDIQYIPELNMLFPRIYDSKHADEYMDWIGMSEADMNTVRATTTIDAVTGKSVVGTEQMMHKPTFIQNLKFFVNYQLVHMYFRYFMWNFAGRQNDIQGNGEVNHGNWISGIPMIDNPRLGDQSLLPDDWGRNNKGHNVFYMLPLLLGVIGLLWQAFHSQRGIEQFWVVFFLFFMTGIAIVLYLNQTPGQPRERDYAFAGSFYAFAIWIGIGVAALWRGFGELIKYITKKPVSSKGSLSAAIMATVVGLIVPLQMVSQTWDDHDRSGRYTTRDYGMNYLSSLDDNAVIFTNGDNDTFPLWYAQEVEGYRTDVRVVNLSYLATGWYANQQRIPSYEAAPVPMLATDKDTGLKKHEYNFAVKFPNDTVPVPVLNALRYLYSPTADSLQRSLRYPYPILPFSDLYIPVDVQKAVDAGRITPEEADAAVNAIKVPLITPGSSSQTRGLALNQILTLDIVGSAIDQDWKRPVYFASTVQSSYYMGFEPYMRSTGLALEVSPIYSGSAGVNTDKMYRNVTERFRWGGLDSIESPADVYLDETVRRMVSTHRNSLYDLAYALYSEGLAAERLAAQPESANDTVDYNARAFERYKKAADIVELAEEKVPERLVPYGIQMGQRVADIMIDLGRALDRADMSERGTAILEQELRRYSSYLKYFQSLKPWQYHSLPTNDRYIQYLYYGDGKYDSYFIDLLQDYASTAGAEATQKLAEEITLDGVDLSFISLLTEAARKEQK